MLELVDTYSGHATCTSQPSASLRKGTTHHTAVCNSWISCVSTTKLTHKAVSCARCHPGSLRWKKVGSRWFTFSTQVHPSTIAVLLVHRVLLGRMMLWRLLWEVLIVRRRLLLRWLLVRYHHHLRWRWRWRRRPIVWMVSFSFVLTSLEPSVQRRIR